jgi:hypothetical protein
MTEMILSSILPLKSGETPLKIIAQIKVNRGTEVEHFDKTDKH